MPGRISAAINPRILPGLIILSLGILFTLHNFNILPINRIFEFWPLILVGVGLNLVLDRVSGKRGLGVTLLVAGLFLQLNNLGILNYRLADLRRYWPVILIGVGLYLALSQRQSGGRTGGIVLLLLGTYFQLSILGLINVEIWRFWPVILIAAGIAMIHKAFKGRALG